MEEDYCPIKENGICAGDNLECNHIGCWEKIHYNQTLKSIEQKMLEWREHRREEVRWRENK